MMVVSPKPFFKESHQMHMKHLQNFPLWCVRYVHLKTKIIREG